MLVWVTVDHCFTLKFGRRLFAAVAHGEFIEVLDVSTFVSIDALDTVADAIETIGSASGATT